MPNNEEHASFTLCRYGVDARDIHSWMDEPSQLYGSNHRWTRHNARFVPHQFKEKYGEELVRAIMMDHILLDKQDYRDYLEPEIQLYKFTKREIVLFGGLAIWVLTMLMSPTITLFIDKETWFFGWVLESILYMYVIRYLYH